MHPIHYLDQNQFQQSYSEHLSASPAATHPCTSHHSIVDRLRDRQRDWQAPQGRPSITSCNSESSVPTCIIGWSANQHTVGYESSLPRAWVRMNSFFPLDVSADIVVVLFDLIQDLSSCGLQRGVRLKPGWWRGLACTYLFILFFLAWLYFLSDLRSSFPLPLWAAIVSSAWMNPSAFWRSSERVLWRAALLDFPSSGSFSSLDSYFPTPLPCQFDKNRTSTLHSIFP